MNQSQKRRQELLNQTRKLYSDKNKTPLVHPRYGSFGTEEIEEDNELPISSFRMRLLVAVMLFLVFASIDYAQINVLNYTSEDIVEAVSQNIDIEEVWNSW